MTTITKFAIEKIDTGERVRVFASLPTSLDLPDGRRVVSPVKVGDEGLGYRLIQVDEVDFAPPFDRMHRGDDIETRDGNVVTITRQWAAWSQPEIDADRQAQLDRIAGFVVDTDNPVRAALLVLLDEFNRHSVVHRGILAAAAAASSLADFKTRMGQVTGIPARTPQDLLGAVRAKLGVE